MKPIYEEVKDEFNDFIRRTDADGSVWSIPKDLANSDYQAYLATLVSNSSQPQAGN